MSKKSGVFSFVLIGGVAVLVALAPGIRSGESPSHMPAVLSEQGHELLTDLTLYFIENRGQMDSAVRYYIKGRDREIYFTSRGVTFALTRQEPQHTGAHPAEEPRIHPARWGQGSQRESAQAESNLRRWAVKLDFVGADPEVRPVGRERGEAVISYFKGGLEDNHTAGIPTHRSLVYEELWPGIDLEYTAATQELKYAFTVAPGADPNQIKLAFRSADVTLNDDGQLVVSTPLGSFVDDAPYVYQQVGATRVDVPAGYALQDGPATSAAERGRNHPALQRLHRWHKQGFRPALCHRQQRRQLGDGWHQLGRLPYRRGLG